MFHLSRGGCGSSISSRPAPILAFTRIMNTNNTPRTSSWQEFRARLFELIEKRRPIASSFLYSEIYFFVTRCMSAFNSPGTEKAETALNAIADDGTFRLIANSWREFAALFPTCPQPTDDSNQVNPGHDHGQAQGRSMIQAGGDAEKSNEPVPEKERREESWRESPRCEVMNSPSVHKDGERDACVGHYEQRSVSARTRSGSPFRP